MKVIKLNYVIIFMLIMPIKSEQNIRSSNYDQLLELFQRWRDFEMPPMSNGAPDYTSKRFDEQRKEFLNLKNEICCSELKEFSYFL